MPPLNSIALCRSVEGVATNSRTNGVLIAIFFLAAIALLAGAAWGQNEVSRPTTEFGLKPIGRVQTVIGSVTIKHTSDVVVQASAPPDGLSQTKIDDPVYLGDVIETKVGGTIGVVFADGTSFNVSENASMEVTKFVYDPKGASNSTLFSLTKGTFTFLAGKAAKTGNMRVETPVGTMGIRGTAPHVEILDNGTVKFTTLVEENKNAVPTKPGPSLPESRIQEPLSPDASARRAARNLNKTLDICRGC